MDCIFCQIIAGRLPTVKVFEDNDFLAFNDINPQAPVHILVVPKIHFASLAEAKDEYQSLLGKLLLRTRDIAQKTGIANSGYKIIVNNGPGSGQMVFHLHLHLLGGWDKKAEGFIV